MEHPLKGCYVLVADDEPLIAFELAEQIEAAGAFVVGPTNTIESAVELATSQEIDAAVLDVRLGHELVYPLAELLSAKGVPCVFASGYQPDKIPPKFRHVPFCDKRFKLHAIVEAADRRSLPPWRPDQNARSSIPAGPGYLGEKVVQLAVSPKGIKAFEACPQVKCASAERRSVATGMNFPASCSARFELGFGLESTQSRACLFPPRKSPARWPGIQGGRTMCQIGSEPRSPYIGARLRIAYVACLDPLSTND
jgi:CheY-like chemotaxis protein